MLSSPASPNVAIGELLWDLIPSGPRLGGAPANYAILSARLGGCATLVSCVGDDELGRDAMQQLAGVSATVAQVGCFASFYVQVAPDLPTGTVSVTLDRAGRPQYVIHEPVAWDAIRSSPALLELASRASVICFETLAQREAASRETIRAFVQAGAADCVRLCDLNLRAPFASAEVVTWCMQHANVLKVSDEELPEVARLLNDARCGKRFPADDLSDEALTVAAASCAQALLEHAPECRLVALTLGSRGSLLADRHGFDRHNGYKVEVVDTIGAGDAFTAGLVHAYVRGGTLPQMNTVSNLCGSHVAGQQGATPELPKTLLDAIAAALEDS